MPHRKHIMTLLQSPTSLCCLGNQTLFIVRTIWNIQLHSVGRTQNFGMLMQVVCVVTTGL
jgi:hypothetical protein